MSANCHSHAGADDASVRVLENEHLRVTIQPDGSLDMLDKRPATSSLGSTISRMRANAGHAWIHQAPEQDQVITTRGTRGHDRVPRSRANCWSAIAWATPEIPDGPGRARKANYSPQRGDGDDPDRVGAHIAQGATVARRPHDHRKPGRTASPAGLFPDAAAGQRIGGRSGLRRHRAADRAAARKATTTASPNPQFPMHRFVDMSDGQVGLAMLNEGLREYEAAVDDDRTLCITLLRGFTAMQSPVIDQWDVYPWMKLAQSLGTNECHYAILPHAGDWQQGDLYREAERFDLPLETAQAGRGGGDMPKQFSFLEVAPAEIVLSAMKKCDATGLAHPAAVQSDGRGRCRPDDVRTARERGMADQHERRAARAPACGEKTPCRFRAGTTRSSQSSWSWKAARVNRRLPRSTGGHRNNVSPAKGQA